MRKPEFIYVSYMETTSEKLWEALTSSEFSRRYWFNTELKTDWKVGSPFALVMNGTTTDVGEVLAFDRPRRLSYTTSSTRRRGRSRRRKSSSISKSTAVSSS